VVLANVLVSENELWPDASCNKRFPSSEWRNGKTETGRCAPLRLSAAADLTSLLADRASASIRYHPRAEESANRVRRPRAQLLRASARRSALKHDLTRNRFGHLDSRS